jgi:renalase
VSRIAVVGAGIAGLTAAADLLAAGHTVTLFDKSGKVGGRCATRRSAAGSFDHGVPNFVARSAAFRAQVLAWRDAGWAALSDDSNTEADADEDADASASLCAYGVPSMNALPQHLAAQLQSGVTLCCDTQVSGLESAPAGTGKPVWQLRLANGLLHPTQFDAVVAALPAEQAAVLLAPAAALADTLRSTASEPCWTVMAAWRDPLPAAGRAHAGRAAQHALATVLRDDTRRGRTQANGVACRRVLHATPQWSRDHLEASAEWVIAALLAEFAALLGAAPAPPVHAAAHRWRYAQVPAPRVEPCGWDAAQRLGACGDAWHGNVQRAEVRYRAVRDPAVRHAGVQQGDVQQSESSRAANGDGIERAWLSGRALAREIDQSLACD